MLPRVGRGLEGKLEMVAGRMRKWEGDGVEGQRGSGGVVSRESQAKALSHVPHLGRMYKHYYRMQCRDVMDTLTQVSILSLNNTSNFDTRQRLPRITPANQHPQNSILAPRQNVQEQTKPSSSSSPSHSPPPPPPLPLHHHCPQPRPSTPESSPRHPPSSPS